MTAPSTTTLQPLTYGKVVHRLLASVGDTPTDADDYPDVVALQGTATFTMLDPVLLVTDAQPDPATVLPGRITATYDADGYLTYQDKRGVWLVASSPEANPPPAEGGRLWRVDFKLTLNNVPVPYTGFTFHLPAGATVDLTTVAQVPGSAGTPVTVGPRGYSVASAARVGDSMVLTLDDPAHTTLAPVALIKGDAGPASTVPGPKGDPGSTGSASTVPGPANSLAIGTVGTAPTPSATITGAAPNQTLNLVLPANATISGTGMPNGVVTATVGTRYVDTAATNGAIEWIKASGTGNTGWQVVYGDTGKRAVTAENGWGAFIRLKRVGSVVELYITAPVFTNVTADTIVTLPTGFRNNSTSAGALPQMGLTDAGAVVTVKNIYSSGAVATSYRSGNFSFQQFWNTKDPWPTILPGTPDVA